MICKNVKCGAQNTVVTQVALAPPACHNKGSPAELHFAQTCEAGDTILVITDGFETHQSSVHAQPEAIYAERD